MTPGGKSSDVGTNEIARILNPVRRTDAVKVAYLDNSSLVAY